MRPLLSSLCLVLLSFTASAQIVGIEEIDSTAYPLMSAFVYAYDGVSLVDPSVAELRIIENDEPRVVYDGLAMLFDPSAGVLAIARRGTKRRVIVP